MREIEFRGQRKDTGEWVYGSLVFLKSGTYIVDPNAIPVGVYYFDHPTKGRINVVSSLLGGLIPVDPETVGQFTGKLDVNKKKIFEGDIIGGNTIIPSLVVKIKYGWGLLSKGYREPEYLCDSDDWLFDEGGCEVIGDIHTNPELLDQSK